MRNESGAEGLKMALAADRNVIALFKAAHVSPSAILMFLSPKVSFLEGVQM